MNPMRELQEKNPHRVLQGMRHPNRLPAGTEPAGLSRRQSTTVEGRNPTLTDAVHIGTPLTNVKIGNHAQRILPVVSLDRLARKTASTTSMLHPIPRISTFAKSTEGLRDRRSGREEEKDEAEAGEQAG